MYDFRSLSPRDFELFVADLLTAELREELGEPLASYAPGPDGGVDLRAVHPTSAIVTVVQCKHRPDLRGAALLKVLRSEAAARAHGREAGEADGAGRHTPEGQGKAAGAAMRVDRYLLATSAQTSPTAEQQAVAALSPLPVPVGGIWARGKLNAALANRQDIERKHFKLWLSSSQALERFVGESTLERSSWLMHKIMSRLPLYAPTPAYDHAFGLLEQQHVVVITGDPGVGKSTLAHLLLLTCATAGWEIVDISSDINEAWRQLKGKPKAFFYDDFLGQSDTAEVNKNEAARIQDFVARIRTGHGEHRLVMTTRDQVLAQARASADDRLRRLDVDHHRARVRLPELTRLDKARILHNHLHFALEQDEQRARVAEDGRWRDVIDHRNFNPRLVESAGLQAGGDLDELYKRLLHALDHPDEVWSGDWQALPVAATHTIVQLATWPGGRVLLRTLYDWSNLADPREWMEMLRILSASWLEIGTEHGEQVAALSDPSRRDFVLGLLEDGAYARQAALEAPTLRHLDFLLKLAEPPPPSLGELVATLGPLLGWPSAVGARANLLGLPDSRERDRPRLRAALKQLAPQLLERTLALGPAELTRASSDPRPGVSDSLERTCLTYAGILGRLGPGTEHLSPLLRGCRSVLEQPWVSVETTFELASKLDDLADDIEGEERSAVRELAYDLVDTAARNVATFEEFEAFERLGHLKDPDDDSQIGQIACQVLESEVHRLRQEDDLGLADSHYADILRFAQRYQVSFDDEGIGEHMRALEQKGPEQPPPSPMPLAPASVSAPAVLRHTDEEIAVLFQILR